MEQEKKNFTDRYNNLLNDLEPIELEPDDKHKSKNKES